MIFSCFNITAFANEKTKKMIDSSFIKEATIQINNNENGMYEICLSRTKLIESNIRSGEKTYETENFVIFDLDEAAVKKINNDISLIKTGANSRANLNDDSSIFDGTCNFYLNVNFNTKSGTQNRTLYKLNSATTSVSVRNGTSVTKMELYYGCAGPLEDETQYCDYGDIIITRSPNTHTFNYPYIYEGAMLGASFHVTASRGSGTQTAHVDCPIFVN